MSSLIRTETLKLTSGIGKPYDVEVVHQEVVLNGLPEQFHGNTFVHITDLHGGFGKLEPIYDEAIRLVNEINPEFIFFTGDYVDKRSNPQDYNMYRYLKEFHAKRGIYACLGNHDVKRGSARVRKMLENSGFHVLVNETVRIEPGLWIGGVDDLHEGAPDIPTMFRGLPPDRTTIVLSHNPRLIEKSQNRDILILSGHTHGAQFRLNFPTPLMICYMHLRCKQVAGWYTKGASRLYVSRGLGVTGKPFRIDCPAEIGVFTMKSDLVKEGSTHRITPSSGYV